MIVVLMVNKCRPSPWLKPQKPWTAPSIDEFVELVAYFGGVYGTWATIQAAMDRKNEAEAATMIWAAALLLAFVSVRGIVRTLRRVDTVTPNTSEMRTSALEGQPKRP